MYLPLNAIRFARTSQVVGPAIVLASPNRAVTFLVTGGTDSMLIHLSGQAEGSGAPTARASLEMIAIEGVSIEPDVTSAYRPALIEQPLGSLVLSDRGVEIVFMGDSHGFPTAYRHPLAVDLAGQQGSGEVGFTRWRATIPRDQDRRVIFEFEATKLGDF